MGATYARWCMIDSKTWEAVCDRCGQRERLPLPAPVSEVIKWCNVFCAKHASCEKKEETRGKGYRAMKAGIRSEHWNDADGNPEGGTTFGNGFAIGWQHGPLGRHAPECGDGRFPCVHGCTRRDPNGAFVEDVIEAAADRLRYYQGSRFASAYNAKALEHLEAAMAALDQRTKDREARAVEGTHKD